MKNIVPSLKLFIENKGLLMTTIHFETDPTRYQHWKIDYQGEIALVRMEVQEMKPLTEGYQLKLNSYDLGVDIELADLLERLRFSHPEVRVVIFTGSEAQKIFCAGANIYMLGASSHSFKVNFCKFTNETRCGIEDASAQSGIHFIAALNGTSSGGGYELALACDEIYLIEDGKSAVSFPEVPLLGVLPGTGGLTRLVDKRKVRRDIADIFSTKAEGVKGKRAVQWGLVDACFSKSHFWDKVQARAKEVLTQKKSPYRRATPGVSLQPLRVEVQKNRRRYETLDFQVEPEERVATLTLYSPKTLPPDSPETAVQQGSDFWIFKLFRELRDVILHLRFNHTEIGLLLLRSQGERTPLLAYDAFLKQQESHWFIHEVLLFIARVLRMYDLTSKSQFTLIEKGSVFSGVFYELALTGDRLYLLKDADPPISLTLSSANRGMYPMFNGLTRLQSHFYGSESLLQKALAFDGEIFVAEAESLGLVTLAPDSLDWEDEIRLAVEERCSLSPDALTGMEASLRFVGPENARNQNFWTAFGVAKLDFRSTQLYRRTRGFNLLWATHTPCF
jgi:benzoyl-CoA-dihydrodiol lyase